MVQGPGFFFFSPIFNYRLQFPGGALAGVLSPAHEQARQHRQGIATVLEQMFLKYIGLQLILTLVS